jgi:hypothetical protein
MVSVWTLESIEGLLHHSHIPTTGTPIPSFALQFKFEIGWLHREGFHDMVKTVWERPIADRMPIQRWNKKLCATCKHFSGWARHTTSILKKRKAKTIVHY